MDGWLMDRSEGERGSGAVAGLLVYPRGVIVRAAFTNKVLGQVPFVSGH